MSLTDIIYNDPSTMERIVKVVSAIWNDDIELVNNENTGVISFYYGGIEEDIEIQCAHLIPDDKMDADLFKRTCDIFDIAEAIVNTIIDLDDDYYQGITDGLGW